MSRWSTGFTDRNEVSEVALADWTTMRVGGGAELVLLNDLADLAEVRARPHRWLGKGANLLVGPEGVDEAVIKLGPAFADLAIESRADGGLVRVGAAHDLGRLVAACVRAGLAGPEGLAGVPATVGGALFMNAGTAHCWAFDWVERVQVVLPGELTPRWLQRAEVAAGYRSCGLPAGTLFLAAELALRHGDVAALKQRSSELRQRKAASQPLTERSAGCIFKNPEPDLPAGKLIDELGCKGERVGDAVVSPIHANFIVNTGQATAADVCALIRRLRQRAWEQRGVALQIEVQTWACPEDVLVHPAEAQTAP